MNVEQDQQDPDNPYSESTLVGLSGPSRPFGPRINMEYRRLLNDIRRMDADLDRVILSEADYAELVIDACSANIHWSLRLEGHPVAEEDMRRMCNAFAHGKGSGERGNIVWQEVHNHMRAHLQRDRYRLPWIPEDVQSLHVLLNSGCGFSGPLGHWRSKAAKGMDGVECAPEAIPQELRSLLDWMAHSPYDELLTGLLFLRHFLRIQPFECSNELTVRALFLMVISNLGLENSRLCRMEKDFLLRFVAAEPQYAWEDGQACLEDLMDLARSLWRSYDQALKEFQRKNILKDVDEASRTLALKAKGNISWFSVSEATIWVPDLSEQRVRAKLNELVSLGVLEKEGRTRATRFRFKDPFLALRDEALKED
jgi:Fic family protein